MKQGAVAVFVKTPGISPIKTRLAAGIGTKDAEDFYLLSCQATKDVLDGFCLMSHVNIHPRWAVAELAGIRSEHWQGFPTMYQGDGDLGAKLHTVYSKLLETNDYVIILGGDCPQINREPLLKATDFLASHRGFTMGKSFDGGFWLIGGNVPIPKDVWEKTPYSEENTADILERALVKIAPVLQLQKLQDVDYVQDFRLLKSQLNSQQVLTRTQLDIVTWLGERAS